MCNYIIPFNKINNENFKIKALNQIRKPSFKDNKSVNCKLYEYGRKSYNFGKIIVKLDGNLTKFSEIYDFKRKKAFSGRKYFQGEHTFVDDEGKKHSFNIYTEIDIGFSKEWQRKIKIMKMDDDVNTDEEQLMLADECILDDLKESFEEFEKIRNKKISYD